MLRLLQSRVWRNSWRHFRTGVQCRRPQLAQSRSASTSANPYPFPANAHPTPHQIFHLPKSATRADVKARYYDLVRIYHPDSPVARAGGVSAETAHARFQAISSAYASLSGKKLAATLDGTDPEGFGASTRSSYHDLSTAMWRARQRRRAELDVGLDERWKERIMVGAVLLAVALFVLQNYTMRSQAIQQRRTSSRSAPSVSMDGTINSKDHELASEESSKDKVS